jgi:hypothetical protein
MAIRKGLVMKNGEDPLDLGSLPTVRQKVARGTIITAAQLTRPTGDSGKVWREFLIRLGGDASNINSDAGKLDLVFRPLGDMEWWGGIPTIPEVTPQSTIAQLIELGTSGMAKIRRPMRLRGRPLNAVPRNAIRRNRHARFRSRKSLFPVIRTRSNRLAGIRFGKTPTRATL